MEQKRDFSTLKFYVVLVYGLCPLMIIEAILNILLDIFEDGFNIGYCASKLLCIVLFSGAMVGLVRFSNYGHRLFSAACIYYCYYFLSFIPSDHLEESFDVVVLDLISGLTYAGLGIAAYIYFRKRRNLFETTNINYETDNSKKGNDGGAVKIILKGILLAAALIFIIYIGYGLINKLRGTIYAVLVFGRKPTILQQKNYNQIADSVAHFMGVGVGFWVAFIFHKMQVVTYERQFLTGKIAQQIKMFVIGTGIGLAIDVVASALLLMLGRDLEVNRITGTYLLYILLGIPYYLGIGVFEEIISRGVLEGYFEAKGKRIAGVIVSVIFFVGIHFINGVYNEMSAAAFLLAGSLVYSVLVLYSRNLWISIGAHFAYDWAVTYLVELRLLQSKVCFFSLHGLITKWQRANSLVVVNALALAVLLVMYIAHKKKE